MATVDFTNYFRVIGSYGTLFCNPISGIVVPGLSDYGDEEYKDITRVDVNEWRKAYPKERIEDADVDILDIGFWARDTYYPPGEEYRGELQGEVHMNDKLWDHVGKVQADFGYINKVLKPDCVVWSCSESGTTSNSFELFLGCNGIAAIGDIYPLTFKVNRGITFLAGKNIDTEIYDALDESVQDVVVLSTELLEKALVKYIRADLKSHGMLKHLPGLNSPIGDYAKYYSNHGLNKSSAWDLYLDVIHEKSLPTVTKAIQKYDPACIDVFYKPADNVKESLYMVCFAARQILANGENVKLVEAPNTAC